jgi:poly-beta-1,6-N-acetyl-D-glucosamine synthase
MRYAVVTPARNEAAHLEQLAQCLRAQTLPPARWVIVDNGSTDGTGRVGARLAAADPRIRLHPVRGEPVPTRGGPVARAFMAGLEAVDEPVDVVVKLDADVTFAPDFFAGLLREFERDADLGIAGGTCYELEDGEWRPRHVTGARVRGATRAYRWSCLQAVLPLDDLPGWDGIDELKAGARGWRTASFAHLRFDHHRQVGHRDASRRKRLAQVGRATYYTGYRPSYLLLRALFKARREPIALAMIAGYAGAALRREPRLQDPLVRAQIRDAQRLRVLPQRVREALGRPSPDARAA